MGERVASRGVLELGVVEEESFEAEGSDAAVVVVVVDGDVAEEDCFVADGQAGEIVLVVGYVPVPILSQGLEGEVEESAFVWEAETR